MLDKKRELLEVGDQRGMARRNLDLCIEVFQRILVCVKNKFLVKKVVMPVFDCLDNGIELNVISAVAEMLV